MPMSLEEALERADELARRVEERDRDADEWKDARPLSAIYRAVQARAQADRDIVEAVTEARRVGLPWWLIGSYLGTSGEAARQRYGKLIAA
ncbi:hypothetical protein [Jiangella anatolica]|uniref:Uncharacterized protein n=1 Tax=Jiangella anatolica TaxID=2670374 RepID=A0A2W2CV70_9ACTN|nr:hypothetical protein [Jiangella anatolica]PZF84113.1 hypothetical protein C1I92_09675 [Jiangella anatolica]